MKRLLAILAVAFFAPLVARGQATLTPMPVSITSVGEPLIAEKQNGSTGSGTSATATAFATPVNVNDTIVIVCASGNTGVLTPSDTIGAFPFFTAKLANDGTRQIGIFYAHATAAAAADQGKCSDGTSGTIALEAYHVQAMLSPGDSYDVSNSGSASSTSAASGSFIPNYPNEYAFGGIAVGTATVTFSALPVNWSTDATINPSSPTNLFTLGSFSQALGIPVSQNLTATLSVSEPWLDVAATFTMEVVPISGVVMEGNPPWQQNVTQVAGTALGTPQSFGSAPTGVVIGTSSDIYVAGTRARSNQTTTATGALDVNLVGADGVTLTTAASGVLKVGIVGNGAATLDQAQGSAVPTNGLMVGGGSVAGATNFEALTVKAASVAAAATDTSLVVQPLVGSHTMSTAAAGTQLVGIVGNSAATLDAATNGAVPTNQLWVVPTPSTAAGAALLGAGEATVTTSVNVKASAGNVFGVFGVNGAASVCWIEFVNSATAGTLGTNPIVSIPMPASGTVDVTFPYPIHFSTGIAVGIATAVNGSTACGTAGNLTVFYQ